MNLFALESLWDSSKVAVAAPMPAGYFVISHFRVWADSDLSFQFAYHIIANANWCTIQLKTVEIEWLNNYCALLFSGKQTRMPFCLNCPHFVFPILWCLPALCAHFKSPNFLISEFQQQYLYQWSAYQHIHPIFLKNYEEGSTLVPTKLKTCWAYPSHGNCWVESYVIGQPKWVWFRSDSNCDWDTYLITMLKKYVFRYILKSRKIIFMYWCGGLLYFWHIILKKKIKFYIL